MRNDNEQIKPDLDWLAFCYIADELEQSERDAFELRLAEDQQARDAVVAAMETAQMLTAALESPARPADKTSRVSERKTGYHVSAASYSKRLVAAAAAMLLAACGLMWLSESPVFDSEYGAIVRKFDSDPNADLAYAWAGSLELADELAAYPVDESGLTDVVFESDSLIEDVDDWMVLALVDLEVESDGETILPGEDHN